MPRAQYIKTNFTSGEISSQMRGRVDVNKYANGAKRLENFIVRPQGGIIRRSGTIFVSEIKDSADEAILQEFVFSNSQAYILEFGDYYIRFHQNGGRLENPTGNPLELVTPWPKTALRELDFAQSADVMYIVHENYPPCKLSRFGASTVNASITNCADNGSGLIRVTATSHGLSDGQNVVISGVTGTTEANGAWTITYVDANNVDLDGSAFSNAYVSGGDIGEVDWTLSEVAFTNGPFLTQNTTDIELKADITTRTATITSTGTAPFVVGDVGKWVEFFDTSVGHYRLAYISAYVSSSEVTVTWYGNEWFKDPVYGSKFTYTGTTSPVTIKSSNTGIFDSSDGRKIIRAYNGGWGWFVISPNSWNASADQHSGAVLPLKSYTFPTTTLRISNKVLTGKLYATGGDVFVSTDVGRKVQIVFNTQVCYATITGYVSATEVDVSFSNDIPPDPEAASAISINNGTTKQWSLGAWCETTGYPSVVTFHEQRLVFAASTAQPQTVWMSVVSDYENFQTTDSNLQVLDDYSVVYTIASNDVNTIQWIVSGPVLLLGTTSGEWQVKASSINEPITPSNIIVLPQTVHGSPGNVKPIRAGSATLFVTRSNRKFRELQYNFELDAFVAIDMTLISEHMLRRGSGAIDLALQREPSQIVWMALADGQLVGMTYEKDQEVVAWHYHPLGGTDVVVESMASVPSIDGSSDTIYLLVSRTINGGTKRYIEYMEAEYDPGTSTTRADAYYVDCGLKYSGASTLTVAGLDHLEGESVYMVSPTTDEGIRPVVSGQITGVGTAQTQWFVGLPYTSIVQTLPTEAGSVDGTAQGKLQILPEVTAFLVDSVSFDHNAGGSTTFTHFTEQHTNNYDLFTGDTQFKLDDSYELGSTFSISISLPWPLTIVGLSYKVQTND